MTVPTLYVKKGTRYRALSPEAVAAYCAIGEPRRDIILSSPDVTRRYLRSFFAHLSEAREAFTVVYLDTRHQVIKTAVESLGTLDGASVYPREIVISALRHGANAVIFAHNHPSGIAEPSPADRRITRRLVDALALVDIRVLDHLIIAGTETVSFAERGLV